MLTDLVSQRLVGKLRLNKYSQVSHHMFTQNAANVSGTSEDILILLLPHCLFTNLGFSKGQQPFCSLNSSSNIQVGNSVCR